MTIQSFTISSAGLEGVKPRQLFLYTNDTVATILGVGYLNGLVSQGISLYNSDIVAVATQTSSTAPHVSSWYGVTHSGSNWSLTDNSGAPGTVTLPTIANHIATFTNTTGGISEDPATAISGGNIQAGLSGTAGTLASFPSAASKGSLVVAAVANTGNTLTTISNSAMGQASVISIPDPGASTANFIVSASAGTQHVTTGSVSVDAGNIAAGSSGHAGTVSSFPGTASKGSLALVAVNNTGNTVTTISNAAMGQASVVTIPDPGAATGNFLVTGSALVSGNFPQNSGTAGLVVDSGVTVASLSGAVTQLGALQQVAVTLNTAAVTAAYATPQTLIAGVAGKVAIIHSATVYTASTGNTAYTTGTAPIIQYGTTVHGGGTIAVGAGLVAGDITAASSQVRTLGQAASTTYTGLTNTAVTFSNATGAYTGGTGTNIVITLVYEMITATI